MKLIDWALNRPQALTAVVLLVAIWGVLAYLRTPVDLFPDTEPPQAVVVATHPGASARDMASDVTQVLEKELNTLDGVTNLTSTSRDGVAAISVEFGYHKTLAEAVATVGNALDRTTGDLPADVTRPRVYPVSEATSPVMTLALRPAADSPKDLADVRLLAANPIQDRLLALPAVGDVEVFGGHEPEVRVAVDREALAAQDLGAGAGGGGSRGRQRQHPRRPGELRQRGVPGHRRRQGGHAAGAGRAAAAAGPGGHRAARRRRRGTAGHRGGTQRLPRQRRVGDRPRHPAAAGGRHPRRHPGRAGGAARAARGITETSGSPSPAASRTSSR
ncbi:MAG: efflux RND transporter permease subunit [Gammaproteobacteria bacterium]|nr:efflux RND transporter permease subunit [Gammaproteobacteria bacterium]